MRRLSLPLLSALSLALPACAREVLPPELPGRAVDAPAPSDTALPLASRHSSRGIRSLAIPDGEDCLGWLSAHGVAFRPLEGKPGMRTPVAVTGTIDGIRYETAGNSPLVCDCRLVVALSWIAPELHDFGVTRVRHSGAYVYRTTRTGRPSLHAEGLAIDVHELGLSGRKLEVERDYALGTGARCTGDSPVLNRLACDLARSGLFREVLTPDDNSDHRDHLHLAIAPL